MTPAQRWIDHLGLTPHPEGGWFRETYRSTESIPAEALPPRFGAARSFSTAIYYLLEGKDFSALHRIRQEEGWHFYDGTGLTLHLIDPQGRYTTQHVGRDLARGQLPQAMVPAGWMFAATVDEPGGYALAGCTVAPGFDFADFEMPGRADLLAMYPHLAEVIGRLTRHTEGQVS